MKPLVIGLTGGIGSGKSTIAKIFHIAGIPVFDSDLSAKKAYFQDDIRNKVKVLLGDRSYVSDHELNRRHIADLIFKNKDLLLLLNNIIHPYVARDFKLWLDSKSDHRFVVKETALLFEAGLYKEVFKSVLVTAPDEVKILRVMKRDGLSRAEVINKMSNQLNDSKKIPFSDLVIENDGTKLIVPSVLNWIKSI